MIAASFGLIYALKPPPLIQNLCPEQVSYASKQILGPQSGHGSAIKDFDVRFNS